MPRYPEESIGLLGISSCKGALEIKLYSIEYVVASPIHIGTAKTGKTPFGTLSIALDLNG